MAQIAARLHYLRNRVDDCRLLREMDVVVGAWHWGVTFATAKKQPSLAEPRQTYRTTRRCLSSFKAICNAGRPDAAALQGTAEAQTRPVSVTGGLLQGDTVPRYIDLDSGILARFAKRGPPEEKPADHRGSGFVLVWFGGLDIPSIQVP